jgi:hypothetical protein
MQNNIFCALMCVLALSGCATTEHRYEYWYTIHELYADKTCKELQPIHADVEAAWLKTKQRRNVDETCGAVLGVVTTALKMGSAPRASGPTREEVRLKDELEMITETMIRKQCARVFAGVRANEKSQSRVEIPKITAIETELRHESRGEQIPALQKIAAEKAEKIARRRAKTGCNVGGY